MTPVQERDVKQRFIDHYNLCRRNKHIFLSINESCRWRPVIFTVAPFVITVHLYHKHNLTVMLQCLKKASRSTFNMSLENLFWEKKRGKNRAAAILSPFRKCPLTPIIPLSTCPLRVLFSPRPPSLLGNLLCKYGLLTADGPFRLWRWKCNYRQQTSPLLSLEGATLISVPSATGAIIDRYQLWGGDY